MDRAGCDGGREGMPAGIDRAIDPQRVRTDGKESRGPQKPLDKPARLRYIRIAASEILCLVSKPLTLKSIDVC